MGQAASAANYGQVSGSTEVLRFGKSTAYAEARVRLTMSGDLVAHAVLEFAF